jgi:diguanylate cyclase (GGDEF)-like protein
MFSTPGWHGAEWRARRPRGHHARHFRPQALEDELRSMAMRDGLTGLANRRAFDEALESQWQRTSAAKSQISLLLIDIDHFKEFNDAHGHQVGDDCLRSVGAALQSSLTGSGGLLARYGGDELAIVLGDADSRSAALTSESARAAVEALEIPHGATTSGVVTISIGAATAFARDGGSVAMPHALLASADRALYMAKEAGRNCCRTTLIFAKTAT